MRRLAARLGLLALALAALFGLWAIRVHIDNRYWPIETFHVRILVMIAVVLGWMAAVGTGAFALFLLVRWLWRVADLD